MENYTAQEIARFRYYEKEFSDKLKKNPDSPLIVNTLIALRTRLGMKTGLTPIDPLVTIEQCIKKTTQERKGL